MRKSKKFASMPVISLEEGRQIGTVKGLVVDPAAKKVAALIIEQKGWLKEHRYVPYNKIHSTGTDAITIEKTSGVEKAAGLPEIIKLLKEKVTVTGARLVAENGTVLGYVDEYYVDLDTGTIAGLEFSGNFLNSVIKGRAFLDIAYVRTLGKEVVVVTNEGLNNIFKLEGGLQETVKTIRESTGQLWENTVQKTREISTSINKSLEKVKKDRRFGFRPKEETPPQAGSGEEQKSPESSAPAHDPAESAPPPGSNGEARKDV
ncbi:MAG: photosystem reaction center subunit H [Pelotomaculum sp.]|nr:photosystem reaction center subunit H [Pelotomaculum sp.]